MRKDVLAAVSALAISSGAAFAAQAAPAMPAPVFSWTGCYVGVHAGGDWGHSDWDNVPTFGSVGINTSGGIYGAQAGCNYQMQSFVIGGEAEIWGSSLSGTTNLLGPEGAYAFKAKSDLAGDLAVRAGWALNNVLLFGKLGVAWAHYKFEADYPFVGSPDTGAGDYTGLLLGLGAEVALDSHWSLKGEYDYIDYGSKSIPFYTRYGAYDFTASIHNTENILKAGVNFRF